MLYIQFRISSNKSRSQCFCGLLLFFLICGSHLSAQVVHSFKGDRFTHYSPDDWVSYAPALEISAVEIDEDYIYFASLAGGILRYDKYRNYWDTPFTTSNGLSSNNVYELVYDPNDGKLYARTNRGIDEYWHSDRWWRPSSRSIMPPGREPRPEELEGIERGKDYHFPPYFRPPNSYLPDFFTDISMMYLPSGILYDRNNRQFALTDRVTDDRQRVWIGTDGMGPLLGELYSRRLEQKTRSISNIAPRDIYIGGSNLWIGGQRRSGQIGGIIRWDLTSDSWDYFEAPFIPSMYTDEVFSISGNKNFVAFATGYGVVLYNITKDSWRTLTVMDGLEGDMVFDVIIDDSTVYCATENGVNWIDMPSMQIYEPRETTLDHVPIYQLAIDKGIIWAATRFGLYKIDPYDQRIDYIASRAVVSDFDLRAIEIVQDEIWCAGSGGISYWNRKTDEWYSFPNLDFKGIYRDILSTKNTIWFATDQGLIKYNRKSEYWRLFTEDDGLISANIYHLDIDPKTNRLWMSSDRGITSFRWTRKGRID